MILDLSAQRNSISGSVNLPASKSYCNRALILRALSQNKISLSERSPANDSKLLAEALESAEEILDIEDAGTAMRFLTAYFAFGNQKKILRGTKRMHERPIELLVTALNHLGASISYIENKGYPPIQIKPVLKSDIKNEVTLRANVSSQYITALLLVAPTLPNGLSIHMSGNISSRPYIDLTLDILEKIGVRTDFSNSTIKVWPTKFQEQTLVIEKDWTAASYFFALAALAKKSSIYLPNLIVNSAQGDTILCDWFQKHFGVRSICDANGIRLEKREMKLPESLEIDFSDNPDLAQTIIVLSACLGINLKATGLHSLRIKETNRIVALKTELEKFGIVISTTDSTLAVKGKIQPADETTVIETYSDHRMAMSMAIISLLRPIKIVEPEVVKKSFPAFFKELNNLTKQSSIG